MPIVIQARRDGFRRCGVSHSAERTEYPDGYWSDADLAILKAEPQLMVVEVPATAAADDPAADQATTDDPENLALVAADPATKPAKK